MAEMESGGTRVCRRNSNSDRITYLPPDVIDNILKLLPLKDAVRISSVSKYWKYRWAHLPQLLLDNHFFKDVLKNNICVVPSKDTSADDLRGDIGTYANMVDHILFRHVGLIHRFVLFVPAWFPMHRNISHWIHFISSKSVMQLTLRYTNYTSFKDWSGNRKLPSCIFSDVGFHSLTHLSLESFSLLSMPSTFRGFPSLISLKLCMVANELEAKKLESFVSKCPLLQSFVSGVFYIGKDRCLDLHAPKLQKLFISGGGGLSRVCLKETKQIKNLSLRFSCCKKRDTLLELFSCLSHIEKLHLGDKFWMDTRFHNPAESNLVGELSYLKQLELNSVPVESIWSISFITYLIQKVPKLQKLEFSGVSSFAPVSLNIKHFILEDEDCCLCHLQYAKFIFSRGTLRITLQLIKFILSMAPILKVMYIEAIDDDEEKLDLVKELVQYYPRASVKAEIIVKIRTNNP